MGARGRGGADLTRGKDQGQLARILPVSGVRVLQCEIELVDGGEGSVLCYQPKAEDTLKTNPDQLLDSFLELADGNPEEILRFARKWGPLRVCQHYMPYDRCYMECLEAGSEHIAIWQDYAHRSKSILNIAVNLYNDEGGDPADWESILRLEPGTMGDQRSTIEEFIDQERQILMIAVNTILDLAGVRLSLNWSNRRPQWDLVPDGSLLGVLATQLAFAVARSNMPSTCTSCGRPYTPNRKPQFGRRNYCPTCGSKAAKRDHARVKSMRLRNLQD